MTIVYLDTETTGLSAHDEIVEIAIVGDDGEPVVNSLVRPTRIKHWVAAERIHGISPAMVSGAPALKDVLPAIGDAISGRDLVIYNAAYDRQYLPADLLKNVQAIHCAMLRFARYRGIWNDFYNGWKWHKLDVAAAHFGYEWAGTAHRALADALACRHVWRSLEEKHEQSLGVPGTHAGSGPGGVGSGADRRLSAQGGADPDRRCGYAEFPRIEAGGGT